MKPVASRRLIRRGSQRGCLAGKGNEGGKPSCPSARASKALPGLLKKLLQEAHASVMRLIA